MIEGLKPYPEYKESGLTWLDRIPAAWDEQRSKYLFREVDRRSTSGHEMRLSMSQRHGLIPSANIEEKRLVSATNIGGKICERGDLVLNRLKAHLGVFALAPQRGLVSPDYTVLRSIGSVDGRYFCTLYRSPYCGQELRRTAKGIVEGFWRLYTDQFYDIRVPVPPPDEQAAIVRFLDHANRKIDGFIRAKRKLIGLLNEQKQAIIHRAVTRGLNPNAPLKPSGIPWLGDIPQHWEIVRNMALFAHRVEPGITGLPVLQVSLRSGITAEELDQFGRPKRLIADATRYKRIHKGDVAYNTMRMWQGAVGVSPDDGLVSPAYVVLKPRQGTCPEFYDFIFHTAVYMQQVNRRSTGIVSDRNRLYWDSFKQMPNLTLPHNEQAEIVTFILKETAALNTAIARTEREISLMQEYRMRLTADVVTGKLDVREAAAKLPTLSAVTTADPVADEEIEEIETEEIEA